MFLGIKNFHIGEKNDLAQKRPEKLKELQGVFARWAGEMEAPRWIRQDASNAEVGGKLAAPGGETGSVGRSRREPQQPVEAGLCTALRSDKRSPKYRMTNEFLNSFIIRPFFAQ